MGNKIRAIYSYWSVVFSEAFRILGGEMRGIALAVISAFILACISTIAYFFNLSSTGWVDQTWEQAFLGLASACVSGGLLIFASFFVLAWIPSKIHNDQEKEKEQLRQRVKSLEKRKGIIKTSKITLNPKEERSVRQDGLGHYVYVEIFNGENNDLRDCYVTLNELYVKTGNDWLNMLHNINPNLSNLTWPAFKLEDEKIIRKNKPARINLAKTISNNIAFTLEDGDHPGFGLMAASDYYVEIEINGNLNRTPIEGIVIKGFVHHISKLIQEPDRPPQVYERLYMEKGLLDRNER